MLGTRLAACVLVALAVVLSLGCGGPKVDARPDKPSVDPAHGAHTESTFPAKDGLTLFEQSFRPTGKAKAAFILVHGLKDHGGRYGELAARLNAAGISVHAMDLRGHGRSAGERVYVEHFQDYLDDLDTYVELVRKRESPRHVFLFGHSMGGAIAALYVIRKSPPLDGLLLSGAALKASVGRGKIFGTQVVATLAPHAAVFQLDLADFSRDPAVVADGKNDPLVYQPAAAANTARELLGAMKPIEDNLKTFTMPLLLMHGEKDVVTDPDGTREMAKQAASHDKTLKVYDGFLHDILHEPDRAKVIDDIVAFVSRLSK